MNLILANAGPLLPIFYTVQKRSKVKVKVKVKLSQYLTKYHNMKMYPVLN
jgi:hypothetical protein